jgi:formylglycine-generating enzyme required for sulfatase activity
MTFTAIDTNAEAYEFFLSGATQGMQSSRQITFAEAKNKNIVTVRYYYPPSYLKPEMIDVPGSSNWKHGNPPGTATTAAIHNFQMSRTEITQAQFEYVMGYNPSRFQCSTSTYEKDVANRSTSNLPAENMNWYHAIAFCNKLSIKEGRTPCYSVSGITNWENLVYSSIPTSGNATWNAATCNFAVAADASKTGYRLPTESEWEYAARGATGASIYYFAGGGSNSGAGGLDTLGWYSGNNGIQGSPGINVYGPKAVGTKDPNELGLHDMSGNVWEWCWSGNNDTFPADTPGGVTGTLGNSRMCCGGSWGLDFSNCRVSSRSFNSPISASAHFGFRVVISR